MPRPPRPVGSRLGAAVRQNRADRSQGELAAELQVTAQTVSRLERGSHQPSLDTAVKLARWLGWTVEQVVEAAGQPAPGEG